MNRQTEYWKISPQAYANIIKTKTDLNQSLAPDLIALIYLRVSQINGCAYCIDLHFKEAKKNGVRALKLNSLLVFRHSPHFTNAERAALAWAEAITELLPPHVMDATHVKLCKHYSEKEIVDMTFCIAQMNLLNRIAISFNHMPTNE